ncbi:type II CAAX prenyl endopeptidase Rce1 family protein [Lentilactobacillus raoultii]|uniref:Type II CAAX prenyl endopeptidase Rce1 family protein n=1 Tax=Lentilactobacillus raoultii TaxID=1987503 RepID=A0ABW3PT54_9LACO
MQKYVLNILREKNSIFSFPLLEELHFRWLIYYTGLEIHQNFMTFIVISSLAFSFSHLPYLGFKRGTIKVFQGILMSILFLKYGVILTILCHMAFNIFVYFYVQNRKENYYEN